MDNSNYSIPTLDYCIFVYNYSQNNVGAMGNFNYSDPEIFNTLIYYNYAGNRIGGMVNGEYSDPTISNCTIIYNGAVTTSDGVLNRNLPHPTIIDSIIWGNGTSDLTNNTGAVPTITFSDVGGARVYTGTGNINSDPLIVDGFRLSEPTTGDAAKIGFGQSPCVNADSDTAPNIGLDDKSTRTDGVVDTCVVDMGFHHWFTGGVP